MTRRWLLALLLVLLSSDVSAQDATKVFQSSLMKRQLYLRGYSAEKQVNWHWDGAALVMDVPRVRTLAVLVVKKVKADGRQVEIRGERHTLQQSTSGYGLSQASEETSVRVDLRGADLATVLPKIADGVFFPSMEEAIRALPEEYKGSVPAVVAGRTPETAETRARTDLTKNCDCASDSCGGESGLHGKKGMKPPHVTQVVDAEFSDEARTKKVSGSVMVGFRVDPSGSTSDFWIGTPMGLGLDAQAVKAVSQYRFVPASCRGTPIATTLFIEVSFKIF